jgi:hypothetical protein
VESPEFAIRNSVAVVVAHVYLNKTCILHLTPGIPYVFQGIENEFFAIDNYMTHFITLSEFGRSVNILPVKDWLNNTLIRMSDGWTNFTTYLPHRSLLDQNHGFRVKPFSTVLTD